MSTNQTESKAEKKVKTTVSLGVSSFVGRRGERSCETCDGSCKVLGSRLSNVRCVISVPGPNLEIPAFFKAWIYEEHGDEIVKKLRNQ